MKLFVSRIEKGRVRKVATMNGSNVKKIKDFMDLKITNEQNKQNEHIFVFRLVPPYFISPYHQIFMVIT